MSFGCGIIFPQEWANPLEETCNKCYAMPSKTWEIQEEAREYARNLQKTNPFYKTEAVKIFIEKCGVFCSTARENMEIKPKSK